MFCLPSPSFFRIQRVADLLPTFGVRQAADILEKATWWFAAIIIVFSIAATAAISTRSRAQMDITKDIQQSAPVNAAPTFPITTEQAPSTEAPATETPAE